MMRLASKASRAVRNGIAPSFSLLKPPLPPPEAAVRQPLRHFSVNSSTFTPNPVAVEMIKYATSLARDQKQCESTQPDDNSKGLVELARSTLLFERGSHEAAIERLGKLQDLNLSSVPIKVAASEALEEAASAVADLALQILGSIRLEIGDGGGFEVLEAQIKALKAFFAAQSIFEGVQGERFFVGNAALSYGEFFHGTRMFSTAKELYSKVIQEMSEIKDFCDPNNLGACNMTSEEVAIAAACALGQLEAHMGGDTDCSIEENGRALWPSSSQGWCHFDLHCAYVSIESNGGALKFPFNSRGFRTLPYLRQMYCVLGANENVHRKDIITLARGMS
ncbi:hypothetical protein DH2020_017812 [Rehmannia glutinosa]|uniref:Uncharacterized protein n=1 Tax=Rehmannia glutinosa TaxID=99300 RepID=A0ABR0WIA2_REHGL